MAKKEKYFKSYLTISIGQNIKKLTHVIRAYKSIFSFENDMYKTDGSCTVTAKFTKGILLIVDKCRKKLGGHFV